MMCEHPDWESADLSSLRYVIYGGSPITEDVAQAWLDRGVVLQQGYGMTEAAPGVFMALPDGAPSRPVSAGVPHFFTDVRLDVDGEAGRRDRAQESCWCADRTCSPATGTGRRRPRRSSPTAGTAPATWCGSRTTAGRTSSTGSRT